MLVVTTKDIEKLHKALKSMDKRALPYAARNALNTSAFATRTEWAKEGERTMTVRNKWTFGGRHHRVVKARLQTNIRFMEAAVGNTHRYMAQQERGFSRSAGGRKGVPIPTTESRISGQHRRLVRRAYWRSRIKIGKRVQMGGKVRSRSQYIAANIRAAKKAGHNLVYLELGPTRGIFDVRWKTKMKLVWDLSRKHTRTGKNPMLRRTLKRLKPAFKIYHRSALEEQIRFVMRKRGLRLR